MVEQTRKTFGRTDFLLNLAAGPVRRNTFTAERFLCLREVLKVMESRGSGSLVYVSSAATSLSNRGAVHDAAAKGAILSMTVGKGCEFAGIRVNAISPGPFDAPFQDKLTTPLSTEKILKNVPAARLGQPREAAERSAVHFSDARPFLIETVLRIDGATTG